MADYRRRLQRRRLRRPKLYRDRTNPLDVFDDIELYQKFRFRRRDILDLTDLLTDGLRHDSNRGGAVPPLLQVFVGLRYFATGTFQNAAGEMIGLSQPTVSLTVQRFKAALLQHYADFVRPPTADEVEESKNRFRAMTGFPHVFGCIDGTHVKLVAPHENNEVFVDRKNFHSINVQIVCDAQLRIIDCVATSPGSFHDSRILRESDLWVVMENGAPFQGFLLGDSAYPCRVWLMTPYPQPRTPQQTRFNNSQKSTRVTVERCIGVLKRRWHCLHTELRLSPARCARLIYCCAMLHNFAVLRGIPPPEDDMAPEMQPPLEPIPPADGNDRARMIAGQAVRDRVANTFF